MMIQIEDIVVSSDIIAIWRLAKVNVVLKAMQVLR